MATPWPVERRLAQHDRRWWLSRVARWRYLPLVGWILLAAIPVIVLW